MSSARDAILANLRKTAAPECSFAERDHLSRFDWDKAERIRRFTERMEAVRAEVYQAAADTWVQTVVDICRDKGVNNLIAASDTKQGKLLYQQAVLPTLRPYTQPIEAWRDELFWQTDASFTRTRGGIAEMGTLIVWPDAQEPRLMSLVPPLHIYWLILMLKHAFVCVLHAGVEKRNADWNCSTKLWVKSK